MKLLFVNAVDQHHGRHNMNVRTTAEGHRSPFATLVVGGPPGGVRMPSGSASQTPLRGEATSCQKGAVSGQTLFTAAYNCIQSLNEARPATYPNFSKCSPNDFPISNQPHFDQSVRSSCNRDPSRSGSNSKPSNCNRWKASMAGGATLLVAASP
jgi:hypothetical protein